MIHAHDTGDTLSNTFCFDCNHSGNDSLLLYRFFGGESCSRADCHAYENTHANHYTDTNCSADQHRFLNTISHAHPYAGASLSNYDWDADRYVSADKYFHTHLDGDISANSDSHNNSYFNGFEYTFTNSYFYSTAPCIPDTHFYIYGASSYKYGSSSKRYTLTHD